MIEPIFYPYNKGYSEYFRGSLGIIKNGRMYHMDMSYLFPKNGGILLDEYIYQQTPFKADIKKLIKKII
ncbi:MAG: hypothetical protein WDA47_05260 [Bacilli bacterium]|jgi:hypothetical protein